MKCLVMRDCLTCSTDNLHFSFAMYHKLCNGHKRVRFDSKVLMQYPYHHQKPVDILLKGDPKTNHW